ncbi:hypothetical protein L218DRAFT_544881 [Marasmius fiardii PR-910]|nr:hypothetical protein L218DRAFT_544881 [Marasmius fiardii PR-910]
MSSPSYDFYKKAVQNLIQGGDFQNAISELTRPTLEAISHTTSGSSGDQKVEDTLYNLWSAFIAAAETTSDESLQTKLVKGLEAIKSLPPAMVSKKGGGSEQYSNWGGRVWNDLPMFGANMRDRWDHEDGWVNRNAFAAQITVAHVDDFELYAIWTLRDALEETKVNTSLNVLVPAAAQWIFIAGRLIYQSEREWVLPPNQGDPARGGSLIPDIKKGFSKERWAFWKKGFEGIGEDSGEQKETKRIATEAWKKMDEIERSASA